MASPPEMMRKRGGSPEEAVREQLARMLASGTFSRSKRLSDFLRFVTEETLAGRSEGLKEQVLAAELYGKSADYDTSADSVVRVDARRLRDKLREYYADCPGDPILISLPKGKYVPVFEAVTKRPEEADRGPSWKLIAAVALSLAVLAAAAFWIIAGRSSSASVVTIAVLPLENLSRDANQDYLAEGVTAALIADLEKIQAVRVAATSFVQPFKVDYIIKGTLLPSGDRVQVTTQLIARKNEREIWKENYEGSPRNTLRRQSEIAVTIAHVLHLTLTAQDRARLKPKSSASEDAVDAYLKGRFYWSKRTPEGLTKSVGYFKQAVAIDPNYALAWAGLADSHSILANYNVAPPSEALALSRAAAEKALQIDDNLAEAHAALANSAQTALAAEPEFARAVEIDPNYASGRQWHAENLMFLGRFGESLSEMDKAIELEPLSPLMRAVRAKIYYYAGRPEDAIREEHQALEMDPGIGGPGTRVVLSLAYARTGRFADAIAELKRLGAWDGKSGELKSPELASMLGYIYASAGQRAEAERIFARLQGVSHAHPYAMVYLNAALGEKDNAFRWLDRAYEERDTLLYLLKIDPDLVSLRTDRRFEELVHKLRLD